MVITKGISLRTLFRWTGHHIAWLLLFVGAVAVLYRVGRIELVIPWLPISVIGTAVAFYVGFKNNQSYDRMWEARKIWGGIVNSSRAWGMYVDGFVTNQFATHPVAEGELHDIKKRLMYRHFAWLYSLRSQLLIPTSWEHPRQRGLMGIMARYNQRYFGVGLVDEEVASIDLKNFLPTDEHDKLTKAANPAAQIINKQSRDLRELRAAGLIDDFRHVQLEQILYHLYEHQGKCERIKKFPLPRQYANISRYFIGIFIALLPFSMVPELMKMGTWGFSLSIPITALIGWVYVVMEIVGDYSENPFQGMANDIPMFSLCRSIEIDLRQMLGEDDLPPAVEAREGVLL